MPPSVQHMTGRWRLALTSEPSLLRLLPVMHDVYVDVTEDGSSTHKLEYGASFRSSMLNSLRMVGRCQVVGNKLRYEIKRVLAVVAGMEMPLPWIGRGTLGRLNLDFFDGGMWIERGDGVLNVYKYAGIHVWECVLQVFPVCVCMED
jgi:hypothetical protein